MEEIMTPSSRELEEAVKDSQKGFVVNMVKRMISNIKGDDEDK